MHERFALLTVKNNLWSPINDHAFASHTPMSWARVWSGMKFSTFWGHKSCLMNCQNGLLPLFVVFHFGGIKTATSGTQDPPAFFGHFKYFNYFREYKFSSKWWPSEGRPESFCFGQELLIWDDVCIANMHPKVTSHKHVQSVLEVQWNDVVCSAHLVPGCIVMWPWLPV